LRLRCAIGRGGITTAKREGDGASPAGRHRLLGGYYRADGGRPHPASALPLRRLPSTLGWCDAPGHPAYNRPVRLPFKASHEQMWRADRLYDVVLVIDWNIAPRRRGAGSAIFLHQAHPDYAPTAGCVALSPRDMRLLLRRLAPAVTLEIGPTRIRPLRP